MNAIKAALLLWTVENPRRTVRRDQFPVISARHTRAGLSDDNRRHCDRRKENQFETREEDGEKATPVINYNHFIRRQRMDGVDLRHAGQIGRDGEIAAITRLGMALIKLFAFVRCDLRKMSFVSSVYHRSRLVLPVIQRN